MKITTSIQKILDELEQIGISDRKILNYLKKWKEELIIQKDKNKIKNIEFNTYINNLIFDGKFDIMTPSNEFLQYLSLLKTQYNNEFVYYCLSQILMNDYYSIQKIHEADDSKKCGYIMYFLKKNLNQYIEDYNICNKEYIGRSEI